MKNWFVLYAVAVVIGATYMDWKAGFAAPRTPSYGSSTGGSYYWGGSSGDAAALEKALRDAASALGATILHAHLHRFDSVRAGLPAGEQGGVTGVLLLAESHLSIHTWPEHGFAAIDAFMCGTGTTHAARAVFEQALAPQRVDVRVARRGAEPASN